MEYWNPQRGAHKNKRFLLMQKKGSYDAPKKLKQLPPYVLNVLVQRPRMTQEHVGKILLSSSDRVSRLHVT